MRLQRVPFWVVAAHCLVVGVEDLTGAGFAVVGDGCAATGSAGENFGGLQTEQGSNRAAASFNGMGILLALNVRHVSRWYFVPVRVV